MRYGCLPDCPLWILFNRFQIVTITNHYFTISLSTGTRRLAETLTTRKEVRQKYEKPGCILFLGGNVDGSSRTHWWRRDNVGHCADSRTCPKLSAPRQLAYINTYKFKLIGCRSRQVEEGSTCPQGVSVNLKHLFVFVFSWVRVHIINLILTKIVLH